MAKDQLTRIEEKVDNLYDKLFEDNSSPCLQTRVDRNTRWISSVKGLWIIIFSAVVGAFAWMFKK